MKKSVLWIFFFWVVAAMNPLSAESKNGCPELTGRVVLPDNPKYDKARLVSNYYVSKNSRPAAIVYAQNAQDVQNAVKWALCKKLSIRVRSGGHSHEGFSTGTDVLVIDVSEMKNVQLDKTKNIATVEPGITGGELYTLLAKEGLTQAGGTCEDVGVSGLVMTGGMGPLIRKEGLTCDTLISFDIVNADGELLHVTNDNDHKDLFWACRGAGGGNFGIVTSLVLHVFPAKEVTWFNIGWDWDQPVEKIIATWQEMFANDDPKWFSHLDVWPKVFPVDKFKKQPIKAMGVYYGTPEQARKDLAPLLRIGKTADEKIALVKWRDAIKEFEVATSVYITDKPEYKSSGAFAMQPLPPEAIKVVVETLRNTTSPLLNVLWFSLGGAAAKKAPTDTAYYYRKAKYFLIYSTQWLEANDDKKLTSELDQIRNRLLPFTQGDYIGNPDRNVKDYLTTYYGGNVERLKSIKRKYDPQNIFNFEQSIPIKG